MLVPGSGLSSTSSQTSDKPFLSGTFYPHPKAYHEELEAPQQQVAKGTDLQAACSWSIWLWTGVWLICWKDEPSLTRLHCRRPCNLSTLFLRKIQPAATSAARQAAASAVCHGQSFHAQCPVTLEWEAILALERKFYTRIIKYRSLQLAQSFHRANSWYNQSHWTHDPRVANSHIGYALLRLTTLQAEIHFHLQPWRMQRRLLLLPVEAARRKIS